MIRAVSRALAVFDAFDTEHMSLSLQEIGNRIAMPKATTFRLVNTLEQAGFLVRLDNQHYCLSLKMVRLAGLVMSNVGIRDAARAVMIEVNRQTGETITLNARLGGERVVIEVVDTPAPLMAIARAGEHIPLIYGAAGRVLLAFMENDALVALLESIGNNHDFDKAAVKRDLQRIRDNRYAVTRGQRVQGLTAISVPIYEHTGQVTHCIALSGPSVRIDNRESELIDIVVSAGQKISDRLGMPKTAISTS